MPIHIRHIYDTDIDTVIHRHTCIFMYVGIFILICMYMKPNQ